MFKVYKKLINYAPEKKYYILFTIIFSMSSAILQVSAFYYIYLFLEKLILTYDMLTAKYYAFKIAGLFISAGLLYFLSLILSHIFAFRLETNLRKYGIDGLTRASFKFFDINSSGKIRKLIDDNAAQTHMAVAHLIPDNSGAFCMPILIIIVGFFVSIRVGMVLLLLSLMSGLSLKLMIGEKEFLKIYQTSLENLSEETVEYVRGMQIIKIFGVDVRNFKALNESIKNYAKYALDYSLSCKKPYVSFQGIFLGIMSVLIPIVAAAKILYNEPQILSLELIMIIILSGAIFFQIMKVMYISMYIFQADDAISKLENLYKSMQEDSLKFGTETEFESHDIKFENVSFGYNEDKLIFKNLSFELEEGKSYALVGPSGSGKSTIAKLISGFYNVNDGQIKLGNKNITDYSKEAIISEISFVFQDSKLFKKSIYENVLIAKKDATREEVLNAMKLAGCDSIIEKFEERENTLIGSKGVYLSGGEKQRIAIARAILKNSKIIIFDEASASIDADSEYELQKAFSNLMKNKTVIMIAHRLTTIKNVDEILVLENGKIIERGTDEQLMQKDTLYKHLQDTYKLANDWRVTNEGIS